MTPWMMDSLLATAKPNSPQFFFINPLKNTVENCKNIVGMVEYNSLLLISKTTRLLGNPFYLDPN